MSEVSSLFCKFHFKLSLSQILYPTPRRYPAGCSKARARATCSNLFSPGPSSALATRRRHEFDRLCRAAAAHQALAKGFTIGTRFHWDPLCASPTPNRCSSATRLVRMVPGASTPLATRANSDYASSRTSWGISDNCRFDGLPRRRQTSTASSTFARYFSRGTARSRSRAAADIASAQGAVRACRLRESLHARACLPRG